MIFSYNHKHIWILKNHTEMYSQETWSYQMVSKRALASNHKLLFLKSFCMYVIGLLVGPIWMVKEMQRSSTFTGQLLDT